jgi:hypothetical protein
MYVQKVSDRKMAYVSTIILSLMVACGNGVSLKKEYTSEVQALVVQIEGVECQKSDDRLRGEKLVEQDLQRIHDLCQKSKEEKLELFSSLMNGQVKNRDEVGTITQALSFYSCDDNVVPDQWSTTLSCDWHDAPASPVECSIQGKVACLWGCNNVDPMLGWHTKFFNSRADLEKEITPKGYYYIGSYEGGDYSRQLDYGFRFQVHPLSIDANGKGTWHNEGPEPSPAFSWFAYLRGWWPSDVIAWHSKC